MSDSGPLVGLLLAGGLARRMGGGDKCFQRLGGRALIEYAIDTAAPQVGPMIINAAGDPSRFDAFNLPVVADAIEGFAGPLAGVLTGMEWARKHQPESRWLVTIPTDAPFFPADFVKRLLAGVEENGADMACARSNGRTHPVFGLWPVSLAGALRKALIDEEIRKMDIWTAHYNITYAEWPSHPVDPFFNINRPEDLIQAETLLAEQAAID